MKPPSSTLPAQGWSLNSPLRFWQRETKTSAFCSAGSSAGSPAVAKGLDHEGRVREVRPAVVAAVAGAAVKITVSPPSFAFVPLHRFEELLAPLDDRVVPAVPVRLLERHDGDRRRVVRVRGLGEPAFRPEEAFQVGEGLGDGRIARRDPLRAEQGRHDQGRDPRLLPARRTSFRPPPGAAGGSRPPSPSSQRRRPLVGANRGGSTHQAE